MKNNLVNTDGVKIFALGGLGEIGKNHYCIETKDSIVIIDAGIKFPDLNMPGIAYIIPDYTYLKINQNKIKALIITHGHEDHIGAIPFIIKNINIPVIYAPKLAYHLIKHKLDMFGIREDINIKEYVKDDVLDIADDIKISFFKVTHSIPDAFGIVVDTPDGRIVTTGDFKVDLTPVGDDIELNKISRLGDEGVDLMLQDSTNAELEGYTPSEKAVYNSLLDCFKQAPGRIIVSTFSSNISRIQQVVMASVYFKRKVCIVGRSMEFAIDISRKNGYIKIPDSEIIQQDNLNQFKNSEICIICTGSQGEINAALTKIANNTHRLIKINPGDTVVFSSSPIPGNGLAIEKLVNVLSKEGANVLQNGSFSLHSSGHPSKQELRLMLKLLKPKYFMPVHGEYRMLVQHAQLAATLGIKENNIFVLENGDSLLLKNHVITRSNKVNIDDIYIDGTNAKGINSSIINERNNLKKDGVAILTCAIDFKYNKIVSNPAIYYVGVADSINVTERIESNLLKYVNYNLKIGYDNLKSNLENILRNEIKKFFDIEPIIKVDIIKIDSNINQ